MNRKGVPQWARINMLSDGPSEDASKIHQEEMVMRHFCYRTKVQERIERSHQRAYKRSFDQIREPLYAFFRGTSTATPTSTASQDPPPTKRPKVSKYCMQASTSHHPLLLPIGIFQSPSCILDRHVLLTNFVSYWKAFDPRTAVVDLPRLLGSLRATLELVVHACLEQEEELGLRHYLQRNLCKNKNQHSSIQDVLLLWASHTRSMDSILVCLEDAGDFSNQKLLHDFINILAELRSSCHAPISLVLVADNNSNSDNFLPSSCHARVGLRVQRFSVDHDHLLEQFWNLYTTTSDENDRDNSDRAFTTPPSWIWQKLRQEHWNHHRSACQTIHHLNQIVAQWYTQPGCWFLEASMTPTLQHLVGWFATYVSAKEFLSSAAGWEKLMSLEELQVTNQQRQALMNVCSLLQASFIPPSPSTVSLDFESSHSSSNPSKGQLLSILFKIRTDLAGNWKARTEEGEDYLGWKVYLDRSQRQERKKDAQAGPLQEEDFSSFINQLIVLVGSAQRAKEGEEANTTWQEGINSMLKEFSNEALQRADGLGRSLSLRNIMLLPKRAQDDHDGVWETAQEATSVQLRREVVATLYTNSHSAGLISSAGILQAIFRDRVSMSREEWFSQFCSMAQNNNNVPREELTHWFVLGTWFLYQCGLVKEGKLQRNGIMHEKASVVWCSGDD